MVAPETTRAEGAVAVRWIGRLLQPPPPRAVWFRPVLVAYALVLIAGEAVQISPEAATGTVPSVRILVVAALYSPLLAYAVSIRLGALVTALVAVGSGVLVHQGPAVVQAGVTATIVLLVATQTVWLVTACLQPREALAWLGLIGAALVTHGLLQSQATPRSLMVAVPLVVLSAATGAVVAAYRRRVRRVSAAAAELSQRLARVRQEDRDLLSRELHDVVAHDITAIAMQARRAQIRREPEMQQEILEGIAESARSALDDLRRMVSVLRGPDPMDVGPAGHGGQPAADTGEVGERNGVTTGGRELPADVERVVAAMQTAGFEVEHRITGDPTRIPSGLVHTLSRAVREMGTNIMRHADPAEPVSLALEVGAHDVVLHSSNGIGSAQPTIRSSGNGGVIMDSRAQALRGRFTMGADGQGRWASRMSLPLVA